MVRGLENSSTKLTAGDQPFLSRADVARLRLGPVLGEGSTARVHLVEEGLANTAVMKVARDEKAGQVLLGEGWTLALLGGRFAPALLGVTKREDGRVALLMERIQGKSLRQLMEEASWDASDRSRAAAAILCGGARALHHLHSFGLNHGDFKPENIHVKLDSLAGVTLLDFGLSTRQPSIEGGTPRYLPQALFQGKSVDPFFADAFALAMTVAEVLLPEAWEAHVPAEELAEKLEEPWRALIAPILVGRKSVLNLRWIADQVEARQGEAGGEGRDSLHEVRSAYLATRSAEIETSRREDWDLSAGLPGVWVGHLTASLAALRACGRRGGLGDDVGVPSRRLADLSPHDRGRFLARVVGPGSVHWLLPTVSDEQLVAALVRLGAEKSLRSLTLSELTMALQSEGSPKALDFVSDDPVGRAIRLGHRPVCLSLLLAIEQQGGDAALRVEAGRAARQMGELELAARLLDVPSSTDSLLERSIVSRRLGDEEEAHALRERAVKSAQTQQDLARCRAAQARVELDAGRVADALALLDDAVGIAPVQEVRALAFLALGEGPQALEAAQLGRAAAETDEESARLAGVEGMIYHALARPDEARVSFSRACELSARASAALEEATFATGWAAAATDMGHLDEALRAGERAEVLFESLGLGPQTGRALLARAAVLSALGATEELLSVAERGFTLSRRTGDTLCEAYLCFCLCDALPEGETKLRFARRGAELCREKGVDERLRAEARLLSAGEAAQREALEWAQESTNREARADWYGARAEILERASSHFKSEEARKAGREIVEGLLDVARSGPKLLSLGPALVSGAHLALRLGMAEETRALFAEARAIAETLISHVPSTQRAAAEGLPWVQQALGSRMESDSGLAQLSDVETLLRALSQRRGFRALLDQTLDLLLLWTRVERGLLLLRAPGEKLVIRAARNLDRKDLNDEQRRLSQSMAERALREGRPVVAVDAVNDVSQIHRSVQALSLRSVLAVPLAARGEVLGVAYLDDRVRRGAFGERELSWVGLIGTIAALAILDERDRLSLKRAARRALRAERRLEGQLSEREARLEVAERELSRMTGKKKLRGDYSKIIGRSFPMTELLGLVDRVAMSDIPALIVGESGTGKELVARAVASSGPRRDQPFIAENCSAVPETLLESTLFGHTKGAFTGATRNQPGLFELAHRGTLFLDEIGDMPLSMQTKLLRVLQEGEVRALGSERPKKIDVRVIVATHKDLKVLVDEGKFREDLYYRLNVVTLAIPPLRERTDDILPLVNHFVKKYSPDQPRVISEPALHRLVNFPWPGNVRQLENEVRRMLVLGGPELTAADLSPEVQRDSADRPEATTLREKVDALERRLLIEALEQARGNRTRAAEALGLSRFGLQKMTQRLQIQLPKNPLKAGRIRDRGLDETQ